MVQRILVAVDGSDPATAALEYALGRFVDAEIVVLHVIDASTPDDSVRYRVLREAIDEQRQAAECSGEALLDAARTHAAESGRSIATAAVLGRPHRGIAAYAEENEIDLIVMGTHDRTGLDRLLLGSVGDLVRRWATIPVTAVPVSTPDRVRQRVHGDRTAAAEREPPPAFCRCSDCGVGLYTRLEFCPGCLGEIGFPTG